MLISSVVRVMFFTADPDKAAAWWGDLLGLPVHRHTETRDGVEAVYTWIEAGAVELAWHHDDGSNPRGTSQVAYFDVDDLDATREQFLAAGATPHRDPIPDDPGYKICQITDPCGAVVGLRGR